MIKVKTALSDPEATEKTLFVNDELISITNEDVFELSELDLVGGDTVTIRVRDTTDMVRNEAMREALMTDSIAPPSRRRPACLSVITATAVVAVNASVVMASVVAVGMVAGAGERLGWKA